MENWIVKSQHWDEYPIGTKAQAIGGGHWIKNESGWKWCTGSTFPTPGGDNNGMVQLPDAITMCDSKWPDDDTRWPDDDWDEIMITEDHVINKNMDNSKEQPMECSRLIPHSNSWRKWKVKCGKQAINVTHDNKPLCQKCFNQYQSKQP